MRNFIVTRLGLSARQEGQTAVEYVMTIGLVSLVLVGAGAALSVPLANFVTAIGGQLVLPA